MADSDDAGLKTRRLDAKAMTRKKFDNPIVQISSTGWAHSREQPAEST
jgi:hypothetical protein